MTTSKTIDLSVKTQQQTVELLTERLNTIHDDVQNCVSLMSYSLAITSVLGELETLDDLNRLRFSNDELEILLRLTKKNISSCMDSLINVTALCEGYSND